MQIISKVKKRANVLELSIYFTRQTDRFEETIKVVKTIENSRTGCLRPQLQLSIRFLYFTFFLSWTLEKCSAPLCALTLHRFWKKENPFSFTVVKKLTCDKRPKWNFSRVKNGYEL